MPSIDLNLTGSDELLNVLSAQLINNLLGEGLVAVYTDTAEDLLNVIGAGGIVSTHKSQQVSAEVSHLKTCIRQYLPDQNPI